MAFFHGISGIGTALASNGSMTVATYLVGVAKWWTVNAFTVISTTFGQDVAASSPD